MYSPPTQVFKEKNQKSLFIRFHFNFSLYKSLTKPKALFPLFFLIEILFPEGYPMRQRRERRNKYKVVPEEEQVYTRQQRKA